VFFHLYFSLPSSGCSFSLFNGSFNIYNSKSQKKTFFIQQQKQKQKFHSTTQTFGSRFKTFSASFLSSLLFFFLLLYLNLREVLMLLPRFFKH